MARHDIVMAECVEVLSTHVRDRDRAGVPCLEGEPGRGPYARVTVAARGTVNGRPFACCETRDPSRNISAFDVIGHLLTPLEEKALRRALDRAERTRVVDMRDGPWDEDAENEAAWSVQDAATVWIDLPQAANAAAKRAGAMWSPGARCWFVMAGIDMAPFEALGAAVRPRPEWRRLSGVERSANEAVKALGARWMEKAWYLDVAVAGPDVLAELRDRLGLRIMETRAESLDAAGPDGTLAPEGTFPEWVPEAVPAPGP